ncbi:hypothetical protein SAMN04488005_0990 [Yoonia tamlensis]|uniref:Uncharacterized protein n=1 Tax=Yoonia tamlensis TaxID=390270 RepID=A0A1I6G313_9RHOB|nr:hypothetical protein [Yoonia tamlensis]SFR36566.1 hypothetical protein SAMN04488005_0990 [Yoonia tamlensis]
MTQSATDLTQLCMSLAAILGLVTLQMVLLRRDRHDPINRRFLFCLRITMLLFIGRVAVAVTGVQGFRVLVLLGAAFIPLAALLLTEGLLRRHAPPIAKTIVGAGTAIFVVSAFWYGSGIDPLRLYLLLGFQLCGFFIAGWLIMRRDRASLSASENTTATRIALSLLLFIPLATSDFLMGVLGLPIQFSALGVLIMCWLAIGLGRSQIGHRVVIVNFVVMVLAAGLVAALVGAIAQLDRDGVLLCGAVMMTALLLVAILNDARSLRSEEQSLGLLQYLAKSQTNDPIAFLRDLRLHPLVEGAAMISRKSLAQLQDATLDQIFAAAPVLRRADPPALGALADDHIAHLFDSYSATHVIMVAKSPRVLIALAMPSLHASPLAETELQVVQRMAALMAEQTDQRGRDHE